VRTAANDAKERGGRALDGYVEARAKNRHFLVSFLAEAWEDLFFSRKVEERIDGGVALGFPVIRVTRDEMDFSAWGFGQSEVTRPGHFLYGGVEEETVRAVVMRKKEEP
jgi:hypothetical protein